MTIELNHSTAVRLSGGIEIRRFTVAEYRQLAELGILTDDDRVELLDGLISPKMIHSPLHDATLSLVESELRSRLLPPWMLRIQSAVTIGNSQPEPDVAVVKGPATRYLMQHPRESDIELIVEIADSSVARDRVKAGIYAAASIRTYWLVNLAEQQVELYSDPGGALSEYQSREVFRCGQTMPVALGGVSLEGVHVADILVPTVP